jgi:hypothetical protein
VFTIAPPLLQQQRNLVLHAQEDSTEVDVDDSVPLLRSKISRWLNRLFDAGVVEGEVEATECFHGLVQGGLNILHSRHVALNRQCSPARFFDQAGRLPVPLFRDIGDQHTRALAGKRQRGRTTNAVRCSGDKRHLSCIVSVLIGCHFFAPGIVVPGLFLSKM